MSEQAVVLHVRPVSATDGGSVQSLADRLDRPVRTVRSLEEALAVLESTAVAAVVCDHDPDNGVDALAVVAPVRADYPDVPVVLCTAQPDGVVAAEATRLGVTEYVPRSDTDLAERLRVLLTDEADETLSESHETIAESISTAVITIDADSRIAYANEAAAALTGYDRSALVGLSFPQLMPGSLQSTHVDSVQDYLDTGERSLDWEYLEFPLETADGETVTVAVSFEDFEHDGEWYCTGVIRDISARKSQERELRRNNESLQRLTELATADTLSDAEIIDRVLELGADRLDLSLGYLSRIDGADYEVVSVVGDHDVVDEGIETDLANTYCRRIVGESEDVFGVRDAAAEGWENDMAYQVSGLACYMGGKVVVDGELYGTLCFADEEPRTEPFSESERTYVRLLAEWTSRELERRERNADLERYENVIEAVDDGVYALNETGHFQLVNDAMTDLTGYEAEALLGAHTSTIKSDAVVERAEGIVREMIFEDRDDEETFDLEIQRADGTSFPAEDHMTAVWDDAGEWFEGTAGIIRDITERKERERELREARHRIQQILDRIGAAFFAVDDSWTLTYWNSRAETVLGRPADEVMGENLWEMFPEAVDAQFHEAYHEAMDTQQPVDFEEYYEPLAKWFRVNAYPSAEGLSVYFHDITDQKERDQKLSGLLETTRSLMQAHTPEAVARTVAAAAETELGFDLNLVRLYDAETDTLEPTAATAGMPDRPTYAADEAYPGEAFQRGETVRIDDFDAVENYDSRDANAAMYVPLDGHGVLSVATEDRERFTDADVSVAEILASNAAAALDRVEREQDLLRYEAVVENVRDMVYVLDADGVFQLVTEPLAEWLGYERAELVGRHPREFLDERSVEAFERQIADLQRLDQRASTQMETTLLTSGGEERPVEIEVSLIDDDVFRGTAGVVRDLTDLKRAREELRDERDRFSYLFNNLPDAVIETEYMDDGALVRSVNPAFTDVFGFAPDAVLDEQLDDTILPPDEAAQDEADRLAALGAAGESVEAEIRRRTADGFRDFLFRGIPYRRDDDRVWSFGIYTDITEQKERQRRLEVLNRVLRHNLRNDLTVVMGLADELDERLDDDGYRALIARLQRKAEQIASLSERAREIERSVSRDNTESTPVEITAVVDSLVETYERQHGVDIGVTLPETTARGADGRIRRVLTELFENSIEHAGPDPNPSVTVETTADVVSITVADDGPGIPEHERAVLTGDEPITQLRHGSGLGLWLVIWLTESYGGTVEFGRGDGATVTLALPRTDR